MSGARAVILAAGEGKRMASSLPKVLHPIAGRPMLLHVIETCRAAGIDEVAVVVGAQADRVRKVVGEGATFHEQTERRGTAHAVLAARDALEKVDGDVIVLFGDVPLIRPKTVEKLRERLADGADLVVAGFQTDDPKGYGRLVMEGDRLASIVEERDATPEQRTITFCNSGLKAFRGKQVLSLLDSVGDDNAQNEFYLTDTVAIAHKRGLRVEAIEVEEEQTLGVNDRVQLADREARWQRRRREELLRDGVTMQVPDTVFLSADTVIERDVEIEPNVWFGPSVTVRAGARLRAFSHLDGAEIGEGCEVGPFARLRPGTKLGPRSKVGNFVETKNTITQEGAKLNHLSYVGDSDVGPRANVGAGTITANYDGFGKYRTVIGEAVFVGSNATLVAPVTIGTGANVAAGSTITHDVPADALALGRARQVVKEDRAPDLRARNKARKEAAKP